MTSPWSAGPAEEGDALFLRAQGDAFRFISYRARSEAEVRHRLGKRYPPEIIQRVIVALKEQRYLDDVAFARVWRQQREQHRPRSEILLRQELLRLGVDREVVEDTLAGFDAEGNAYRAGSKLARRLPVDDQHRFRQRLWAYLRRRGFDGAVIGDTVERLWQELAADPLDRHEDADSNQDQSEQAEERAGQLQADPISD